MAIKEKLQQSAMLSVDALTAGVPRKLPSREALQNCKIIAHRGEHDNKIVLENTLQSFRDASAAGVWGVECDIRWTADLVPVICHDADGRRVFGNPATIQSLSFQELRACMPLVPSLAEVIAEFGGTTHLMLELKAEPLLHAARQRDALRDHLSALQPGQDFHILALDPALFQRVDFLQAECFFPVAEVNVAAISRACLAAGYAGMSGHFLLLGNGLKQRHELAGQRIGTGFIASRNCLFRELNRGVEWIFSNDAVKIQRIRDHYLQLAKSPGQARK